MGVTEKKLSELLGYTSGQVRRRRQLHWMENVHYWRDEANCILYDVNEIETWQTKTRAVSMKSEASAESGMSIRAANESKKSCRSLTTVLV